jgi:hypothetical protein
VTTSAARSASHCAVIGRHRLPAAARRVWQHLFAGRVHFVAEGWARAVDARSIGKNRIANGS